MTFLARSERLGVVGSTNDVVRGWLATGTREVCLAVADEQAAGRGREGRVWVAPHGAALLLSVGFRPDWLAPDMVWRLAAIASLAMAEAAEEGAGLAGGTVRLKWPTDLVLDGPDGVRKLAGVLGETDGLGTDDPRAVIGLGVNADWDAAAFPADLAETMTSLRAVAGASVDGAALLDGFIGCLEDRTTALRAGRFDGDAWATRQVTTGRLVRLERSDRAETVRATGVDPRSGALLIGDRSVVVGEITHVRVAGAAGAVAEAV